MGPNRNDGHNTKLQILNQPDNGLDRNVGQAVVEILSNEQFTTKARKGIKDE